jgi:nucleotide-binding universal stress UspA family protein
MIKDILVCLEGSQSSAKALELGLELARRPATTLTGLAIIDEPAILTPQPVGIGGSAYRKDRDQELLRDAEEKAAAWVAAFARRCRDAGVIADGIVRHGRPAEVILAQSEVHDLTVLGRNVNFRFETEERDPQTRDLVIRRSTVPLLVVPEGPPAPGTAILVAYDATQASNRALHSFGESGLGNGRPVHVATVGDDGGVAWETAEYGCRLLRRYGIHATSQNIVSTLSIAEAILERARKLDAAMVVLGVYARSRFARLLWGTVTDEIIAKTTMPLFLHY